MLRTWYRVAGRSVNCELPKPWRQREKLSVDWTTIQAATLNAVDLKCGDLLYTQQFLAGRPWFDLLQASVRLGR